MKILVINPNSSAQMTADIRVTAEDVVSKDTSITVCCVEKSPQSIEGFSDGVKSANWTLELVTRIEKEGFEGFVVACFDDTGVDAIREQVSVPVLGIGEAAMHVASMISSRYSIITSLERSVPIIEDNAMKYGLMTKCRGVHAFDLPVLAFEKGSDGFDYSSVLSRTSEVMKNDRSESMVLGCGGMSHLRQQLEHDLGVPVVDGVSAGIKLMEGLIGMQVKTSKAGAYALPIKK